jgi:hypothetical protein
MKALAFAIVVSSLLIVGGIVYAVHSHNVQACRDRVAANVRSERSNGMIFTPKYADDPCK